MLSWKNTNSISSGPGGTLTSAAPCHRMQYDITLDIIMYSLYGNMLIAISKTAIKLYLQKTVNLDVILNTQIRN